MAVVREFVLLLSGIRLFKCMSVSEQLDLAASPRSMLWPRHMIGSIAWST